MTEGRVGHLEDISLRFQQLGIVDANSSLIRRWRSPAADNDHPRSWLLVLLHLVNIGMLVPKEEDGQVGPSKIRDTPPLCRLNDHHVHLNLLLAITHRLLVAA